MSQGKCIGALLVQGMDQNQFTDADIPALETRADQLGTGIENARLYQKRIAHLD